MHCGLSVRADAGLLKAQEPRLPTLVALSAGSHTSHLADLQPAGQQPTFISLADKQLGADWSETSVD